MGKDFVCSIIVQPTAEIAEMCVELLLQEDMPVKSLSVCLLVTYVYGGATSQSPEMQESDSA